MTSITSYIWAMNELARFNARTIECGALAINRILGLFITPVARPLIDCGGVSAMPPDPVTTVHDEGRDGFFAERGCPYPPNDRRFDAWWEGYHEAEADTAAGDMSCRQAYVAAKPRFSPMNTETEAMIDGMVPPLASERFHWIRRREIASSDQIPEWTTIGEWNNGMWTVPGSRKIASPNEMSSWGWSYLRPLLPHPLVVDEITGLCRYVTQDDIRRMEAICAAFDHVVGNARSSIECADRLRERLRGSISNG
jgi:hypothetical protein